MTRSGQTAMNVINKLYEQIPAFTDVFDEESFYAFAACFTVGTIVVAFVLSRFITIKAID